MEWKHSISTLFLALERSADSLFFIIRMFFRSSSQPPPLLLLPPPAPVSCRSRAPAPSRYSSSSSFSSSPPTLSDRIGRRRGGNGWRDAPAGGAGTGAVRAAALSSLSRLVLVLDREKSELQPLRLSCGLLGILAWIGLGTWVGAAAAFLSLLGCGLWTQLWNEREGSLLPARQGSGGIRWELSVSARPSGGGRRRTRTRVPRPEHANATPLLFSASQSHKPVQDNHSIITVAQTCPRDSRILPFHTQMAEAEFKTWLFLFPKSQIYKLKL